jgi:hypothetical protein
VRDGDAVDADGALDRGARCGRAKSCGSDTLRLVSSSPLKAARATVARVHGSPRRARISRKLPRRESRIASAALYARVRLYHFDGTRDRGCSVHPAFPAPFDWRGREVDGKPRAPHAARSRTHILSTPVGCLKFESKLHQHHCERSEAIQLSLRCGMDCFVASAPRNDLDGLMRSFRLSAAASSGARSGRDPAPSTAAASALPSYAARSSGRRGGR